MRRPLLIFTLFTAAYLAFIASAWLGEGTTAGELAGHTAKIEAILHLLRSGDFAWFPEYLTGSPTATLLSFALSIPIYAPGLLLAPTPALGMKITGMILLALGGFAAFAFGRRLDRNGWGGFAVGVAYLLSPQLLLRLGWQEHMTIITAVPFVPLSFFALLRVAERGSPWDALLLAVSYAAALLAWSKMGATLAIPLALFAAWLFISRSECRENLLRGALWATPFVILLGVVPLLPLLRERSYMTVFELDPFKAWQNTYAAKVAISWFDRNGDFLLSLPNKAFRIDRGGYYLGLVGFLALAWTIFRTWRNPSPGRRVAAIRIFALLALLMFWISLGPRTVFEGHLEFLSMAESMPDFSIPLHWLALAACGVLIFWCLPRGRWRLHTFFLAFGIFLFIPIFRILEPLPLFADLRAPDSFWILNGTFSWCVASALAVVGIVEGIRFPAARIAFAAAALAAACFDFSPYFDYFSKGALPTATLANYRAAATNLNADPGRILAITGRYFFLDLPLRTGRGLSTEALNHYLMPVDTARLQTASRISATDVLTYFRLSGIGTVLVDRNDPDVSRQIDQWFRSLLPVTYENEDFTVLSNPVSLYPGFFATSSAPAAPGYEEYADALELGTGHHLVVTNANPNSPGIKPVQQARATNAPDFEKLAVNGKRTPSHVTLRAPGREGWVVLSESFHPDWKATVDGRPRQVSRGGGDFPAVPITASDRIVEFSFEPPEWYGACLATGGIGWLLALAGLCALPVIPSTRRRFFATREHPPRPSAAPLERPPIARPLIIVPTFNEAETISSLLDALVSTVPVAHVLIVDDASPDGTANLVESHAGHGERVHLLSRPGKLGLGTAYREGFRWAIDRGYDACVEIDADFSHDPSDIAKLLSALDTGNDAAIGSRYLDGVRVINWPQHRLLLSAGASRFVRAATGLPLTDATSGFKALRVAALERIDWSELRADGYGFQVELHWLLWTSGCRIVEVPIIFTERRAGQTKMSMAIAFEAMRRVLHLALKQRGPNRETVGE